MSRSKQNTFCFPFFVFQMFSFVSVPLTAGASTVSTHVLSVGGQSKATIVSCNTYRAPSPVFEFFSTGVIVPTDGLSTCGIAGGFRTNEASSGPLSDTTSLNTSFNNNNNQFSGTVSATAQYGQVGAKVDGEFVGLSNSFIVKGAQAFGMFQETGLNVSTPADTIRFQFTVDGKLSVQGPSQFASTSDVEVNYQLNNGPIYSLMRAQINGSSETPFIATGVPNQDLSGFTLAPGSLEGSGAFRTFDLPITSEPFDFKFGLLTFVTPSTGGINDANFFSTAKLTSIELFNKGQPVTNFTITSDSGTVYGPTGVQPVPEPHNTILGFMTAIGFAAWFKRKGGLGSKTGNIMRTVVGEKTTTS